MSLIQWIASAFSSTPVDILPFHGYDPHLGDIVRQYMPPLQTFEEFYRNIHQHPELSGQERETSKLVGGYLEEIGYTVHRDIGGHGLVGILKNGQGPVVMLRSELDALPILEQTNVSYASTVRMRDEFDIERPVMHACGHDIHMASLMAACKLLQDSKPRWNGTVIAIFQPNEEHTGGAQAMVDDGLYDTVPVPDIVLAQHSIPARSGTIFLREGPVLATAMTIKIRIQGTIRRTANPQDGVDPIMVMSRILVALASLSNDRPPQEGFVKIASREFHAGDPGADVVDEAEATIDIKTYDSKIQARVLDEVKKIVHDECKTSKAPKEPDLEVEIRAPLTFNAPRETSKLSSAFAAFFGSNHSSGAVRRACEDFSLLATSCNRPYLFWFFGRVEAGLWDAAEKQGRQDELVPQNHSPCNAPVIQPTLQTGTSAMALAALTFLEVSAASTAADSDDVEVHPRL